MKIPTRKSEVGNRRRAEHTMAKRNKIKEQTITYNNTTQKTKKVNTTNATKKKQEVNTDFFESLEVLVPTRASSGKEILLDMIMTLEYFIL